MWSLFYMLYLFYPIISIYFYNDKNHLSDGPSSVGFLTVLYNSLLLLKSCVDLMSKLNKKQGTFLKRTFNKQSWNQFTIERTN